MSNMVAPSQTPVWVNEARCKACDICVSLCPAGVLGMRLDPHKVLGKVIEVAHPESCIGCQECELHCPDFAIYVADRKEFKFAKITPEAQERAQQVRSNHYMALDANTQRK